LWAGPANGQGEAGRKSRRRGAESSSCLELLAKGNWLELRIGYEIYFGEISLRNSKGNKIKVFVIFFGLTKASNVLVDLGLTKTCQPNSIFFSVTNENINENFHRQLEAKIPK
jgi:hypothetical protein